MKLYRRRGYTLFEVVLVTAIIGILFSLAIVTFSPDQKQIKYKYRLQEQTVRQADKLIQT